MWSFWKIAVPAACVCVIGAAVVLWSIHHKNANEQRLVETAQALRFLANNGNAKAEHDLGSMYSHGQGVAQDDANAVRWYRKSAEQGNAEGENGLGYMYQQGRGVEQNYSEALRLYRLAADQGNAKAEDNLGLMYAQGQGLPQNYAEALRWYRKAAEQGAAPAEYNIGNMYYFGRGVQMNIAEAGRWFRKAADQGDEYAMRAVSLRFSTPSVINLLILAFIGLALATKPLSLNVFESGESLRDFKQKVSAGTGLLFLATAGLTWYGYTHHLMRSLAWDPNTFTLMVWLLRGISFGLFGYVMLSKRKPEPEESPVTPA
jgi:TPR repeat protein